MLRSEVTPSPNSMGVPFPATAKTRSERGTPSITTSTVWPKYSCPRASHTSQEGTGRSCVAQEWRIEARNSSSIAWVPTGYEEVAVKGTRRYPPDPVIGGRASLPIHHHDSLDGSSTSSPGLTNKNSPPAASVIGPKKSSISPRLVVGGVPDDQECVDANAVRRCTGSLPPRCLKGLGDRRIVEEDIRP